MLKKYIKKPKDAFIGGQNNRVIIDCNYATKNLPDKSWETEVNVESQMVKVTVRSLSRLFEMSDILSVGNVLCKS